MLMWKNTSKRNRRLFKRNLKKKYNISLKKINKNRCLKCFTFDVSSVKTGYCTDCYYYNCCDDCNTVILKKHLKCIPASYHLVGKYEDPRLKYVCPNECIFKCVECDVKNPNDKLFLKNYIDLKIYCLSCIHSKYDMKFFVNVCIWYGLTLEEYQYEFPNNELYEDYDNDIIFNDEIFMFSFYLYLLFREN
jgi:hypothetical protein